MGELDVWGSSGVLDVLQIGRGHLRMTIEEGNGVDVERARRVLEDMMRRGYAIFVEEPDGTTHRVLEFDPERFVYVIDDTMATVPAHPAAPTDPAVPGGEPAAAPTAAEEGDGRCGVDLGDGRTCNRPTTAGPCWQHKGQKRRTREVPVGKAKATAIGRSAGG